MPRWRNALAAFVAGAAFGFFWLTRHLRGWSNAIERGDYECAQRHLRRIYWFAFPTGFRRPPRDVDGEDDVV
jgi:hypothetical protein